MGQGQSLTTSADPLVQRQGSCRAASDGKQRWCYPRSRPCNLGYSPEESNGHSHTQATRVSSSTAQACLHPQAKRQKTSSGHSDASFILPSLPGAFGIPCRCESAELTHAASTVAYFPRVDESPVVSNGAESACAALR